MDGSRMKTMCSFAAILLAGMVVNQGYAQPDSVILDDMTEYYQPVEFDHVMHVDLLGEDSCAVCHHHTVGTPLVDEHCIRCHENSSEPDSAACRDCHEVKRFSAEYLAAIEKDINLHHADKPGLKGAFHQRCLGCHMEMGVAADCQVCHARTEEGDRFFHSGQFATAPASSSSAHE